MGAIFHFRYIFLLEPVIISAMEHLPTGNQKQADLHSGGHPWCTQAMRPGSAFMTSLPPISGGRAYAALADFFAQCAQAFHAEKVDIYAVMDGMLDAYRNPNHLLVDTAFEGTRCHPERRSSIRNLTTGNFDPASLTYGVLDGIARELYERYQTMCPRASCSHSRIIGFGNGLRKNAHLQKIIRERFGMQLQLSQCREEAACGAAIAAFTAVSSMTWREVVGI